MADSTRERKKSKKPSSQLFFNNTLSPKREKFIIISYQFISLDTNFKQQRLKAWQPILTASTALPLFFTIGVVFIPIGAVLLVASDKVSVVHYLRVISLIELY